MARGADGGHRETSWDAGRLSLWLHPWRDAAYPDEHPTSVVLRHPTSPFVRILDNVGGTETLDTALQNLAHSYLSQANAHSYPSQGNGVVSLKLPERWLNALGPGKDDARFGWLPIGWPPSDPNAPVDLLASFHADRRSPDGIDRTTVLLATERAGGHFLGSGFGIRVVAHMRPIKDRKYEVRITGMSASLPFGPYLNDDEVWDRPGTGDALLELFRRYESEIKDQIATRLGLQYVAVQSSRVGREKGEWQVTLRGTGLAGATIKDSKATPYLFNYLVTFSDLLHPILKGSLINKVALVADATPGHAGVFLRDPASQGAPQNLRWRRPSRSEQQLNKFRVDAKITEAATDPLQHPLQGGCEIKVVACPGFVLADAGARPDAAKTTNLSGTGLGVPIRSNDFAAVSAFKHVKELFERLEAYGISARAYFRHAQLPLKVAYRSGIRPGPGKDGQTVNARVLPEHWPVDVAFPSKPDRPGLEMHLALANLFHRARKPSDREFRSPAEPLGIAADPRWIWHEIGHVLLMASVGELEFRFAHSPGDALAAIVADPQSALAVDANWRGATFPWVFIPRRHDRCVLQGWSWGGSLHPGFSNSRRKGYVTEQILSSSLFRLYQCLGGDTRLPKERDQKFQIIRETASHYSVYLIMRGLQLLGSPGIVPADDPDELVSALIEADVGTGKWEVRFPPGSTTKFRRTGGCAHKVIRWAFEAQGMYAPSGEVTNAPGLAPPVDIYIADGRPTLSATHFGNIQYGPGNYTPVSLHWNRNQKGSGGQPLWQATPAAIKVRGKQIHVTVGNRGSVAAQGVKVNVWWRQWPRNTAAPDWHRGSGWTRCKPHDGKGQTIAPGASTTFGPFSHIPPRAGGRYLVLAEATCADDPANTDTATLLPCSRLKTPLIDLVAGDNNLGLRVIGKP